MERHNVSIGSNLISFHKDCSKCKPMIERMRALEKELELLREERRTHMSHPPRLKDPEDRNRGLFGPKVNLHLSPEDVAVPSAWSNQANKVRERLERKRCHTKS